jgi:luciferase family oxidoreductase group 1
VDLGLGRAAGTDRTTTYALQRDRRQAAPDDFPSQLAELLAHLDRSLPAGHPFARVVPLYANAERPSPWLLGSSPQSGIWASELGLPYAFADFISPIGAGIMARYREAFAASSRRPSPQGIVAVWALCAETAAEAERLASSSRMAFALFQRGEFIAVPPIDTALEFLARPQDPLTVMRPRRVIVGEPGTVAADIRAVAAEYGVEEVMVVTITYDHGARRRSYELLAREFRLAGGSAAPAVAARAVP